MSKKHRDKRRGRNLHHIFPQSRWPSLKNESWNQVDVNVVQHDRYHWLFKNRSPEEIIDYLVNYFWGGYVPQQMKGFSNGMPSRTQSMVCQTEQPRRASGSTGKYPSDVRGVSPW